MQSPTKFAERMEPLGFRSMILDRAHRVAFDAIQMNDELQENVRRCVQCDLSRTCSNPVPGVGPTMAPIMIVGEAPGAEEDEESVPFVGESGQLLNLLLAQAKLKRRELYITNAVKCRPPKNRTPAQAELKACYDHLRNEIKWIRPRLIITLGNTAMHTIRKDHGLKITRERGKLQRIPFSKSYTASVMHTFHPSYVLRQEESAEFKDAYYAMYNDIKKAVETL